VWATPAPGGGRIGFPEGHENFQGILPPAIGPASETLAGHDLVLAVGTSVFPYHPYIPGRLPPEDAARADHQRLSEAARAPMGNAIVGDVALAPGAAASSCSASERPAPAVREPRRAGAERTDQRLGGDGRARRGGPQDGIAVGRPLSSTVALRNRLRLSSPGSYYFSGAAASASGFVRRQASSSPSRSASVVCVLGEGSAQYGITALWSAGRLPRPGHVPQLRNEEYMILKWFAELEALRGARLDLKGP
jgi:benzoylformate decarboxylase